jgi:hypothetical protein
MVRTMAPSAWESFLYATTTAAAILAASAAGAADWKPRQFDEESILEFRTVNAEGEGHWSKVWLVVLEDQVYVNLGDRAAERLKSNATAPMVSVRVGDEEFENVRVEPAQELQPAVAQAIADKYWTGFLVPHRPPSQVMRLRPDQEAAAAANAGAEREPRPTGGENP